MSIRAIEGFLKQLMTDKKLQREVDGVNRFFAGQAPNDSEMFQHISELAVRYGFNFTFDEFYDFCLADFAELSCDDLDQVAAGTGNRGNNQLLYRLFFELVGGGFSLDDI